MIDREPTPQARWLDTHIPWNSTFADLFCRDGWLQTHTYTHEWKCIKKLFFFSFYRRCDTLSFIIFEYPLFARSPLSFSAIDLSSSLCMQPHFPLDWNHPNRFLVLFLLFFLLARQPFRVEWRLVGIVRLHSASRPRFISNLSCAIEAGRISEKRERGLKEVRRNWKRSISINPHSSVFSNLLSHYMYLSRWYGGSFI